MPFLKPFAHKQPFNKPQKELSIQKPHPSSFPSAPTYAVSKLGLQKQKILYGRLPPSHGVLQPHQLDWLIYYLSQPIETELLNTKIAALGPPLTRNLYSHKPNCLCEVHTWFELRWIEELSILIGGEIGPGLENLRYARREMLSKSTKKHMKRLEPYRHLFPVADANMGTISPALEGECKACVLSQVFQNPKVVRALEIVAKGRKKRGGPYPELCAWLDPKPGEGWEAKWKRQASYMLKDRSLVHNWLKKGEWESTTSQGSSNEIDMGRESNVFDDADGQRPGTLLPGERPVSFIPSFREMTPSPPGSPLGSSYGSAPSSTHGSISEWDGDTDASSVGSVRDSSYTWEGKLVDDYTLDPKRWCFDENVPREEVLTNIKNMGEDEDDSDDEDEEKMRGDDRKAESRAISYANMIGGYDPTGRPNRAGGPEKARAEDDDEETLVNERMADNRAVSYAKLIGELPPTRTNSVMPHFDERGFF